MRDGLPHAGYRYCAEWGQSKKHGRFSVTSNVDGHWGRVMGTHELWECHGAVTHMQSGDCDNGPIWSTDPHVMARIAPPPWDLKPGEVVEWGTWANSEDVGTAFFFDKCRNGCVKVGDSATVCGSLW